MIDPRASDQRLLRRLDAAVRDGQPLAPAEQDRARQLRDGIAAALCADLARRAGERTHLDRPPVLAAHCDWAWRPAPWRLPAHPRAWDAGPSPVALGPEVRLFHDCPRGEIAACQIRGGRAPFALAIDIYAFRGSYLSLAIGLPPPALDGLCRRHVIRIDLGLRAERSAMIYARLNLQRGSAPANLVRELPGTAAAFADFDLALLRTDAARAERAWIDLILDSPPANRLLFEDLRLSRMPRAEV